MSVTNGNGKHSHPADENKARLVFWEVTKGCNLRCIHCRATATELSSPTDLPTRTALNIIEQIAAAANPILVLSGGEPLYRSDIFQLARYGTDKGLRVALATNGTLVTKDVARMIVDAGVRRVSISLDGADALTHDSFRGIPGAFEAAVRGLQNLKALGMSVQINMTIARHNAHQLPDVLQLARNLGADALHTFLLVPVGCGVDIAAEQMVPPEEYERMLNWFYDQSLVGGIELKATCAPHYFRVARQRRAADRRAAEQLATIAPVQTPKVPDRSSIGPTDMTMPGSTGIALKSQGIGGHPGGHPSDLNAMTKGCLAGTGVCFISHEGEIYPCGYLPVIAGDLRKQTFADIWENSTVFHELRDTSGLKGKCGCCEFRNVCMGCRARAYAATGDFMDEEPFCVYQPRTQSLRADKQEPVGPRR
ncbi:MAG: radical SAM/SPASM domain-containing protein [Acidobacteria bacterium]|nr:MAG: radical SAM/SPASM domain-containing protein [Acidobacteriota bacterium]